jgi:drug/metabolite transporter (DMT)-like permease
MVEKSKPPAPRVVGDPMSSMKPKEWWLLILLSVFWGGSFFFVKVALLDFQPFTLVFLRIAIAALILVGVVYLTGKRMPTSFKTWSGYAVMGMLNNAIPFSLIVWGQTRIESGVASILNATTPIFAVLLGVGILGEVIKVLEYAGIVCIFLGLIIIDGRALNLVKRLNGRRAIGKREDAALKAAS